MSGPTTGAGDPPTRTSRWLAAPDATPSQLIVQATAELREAVTLPAPTAR